MQKFILKFRFDNFGTSKYLSVKIDNKEFKNHGAETSGTTLETPGCKIDLKIPIWLFRNIQVVLSKIDNEEFKNHGAETSGPTVETPGCKHYWKNPIFNNFGKSK